MYNLITYSKGKYFGEEKLQQVLSIKVGFAHKVKFTMQDLVALWFFNPKFCLFTYKLTELVGFIGKAVPVIKEEKKPYESNNAARNYSPTTSNILGWKVTNFV